jgi:hypothetical protein
MPSTHHNLIISMDQSEIMNLSKKALTQYGGFGGGIIIMPATSFAIQEAGKLFEPDALLCEQFYSTSKRNSCREPERKLMLAILEDAISCMLKNPRRGNSQQRKQYEEARHWLTTEEEGDWMFSFKNICDALSLDPNYVRRGLMRQGIISSVPPTIKHRPPKLLSSNQRKKIRLRVGF